MCHVRDFEPIVGQVIGTVTIVSGFGSDLVSLFCEAAGMLVG